MTPRPRLLHPAAWWGWALCVGIAATRTANPWLLLLLAATLGWVVGQRREPGTGRILAGFLAMGGVAIVLRLAATVLLGGARTGGHLLGELPALTLPGPLAGVRLGGSVHLEPLLRALYDGAQIAVVLGSVGAANALAGPRRLLRYVPATLYDVGTALVVGLTYAPRLGTEARRLALSRRLRGHTVRGLREPARLVVPVVAAALDGALDLAASMECRGYGRSTAPPGRQLLASGLAVAALAGTVIGTYALLDGTTPPILGMPMVVLGLALAAATLMVGSGRDRRTRYRRDPFAGTEALTLAAGVVLAAAFAAWAWADPTGMRPPTVPLAVPDLPLPPVLAVVVGALPGFLTPDVPSEHEADRTADRLAVGGASAPGTGEADLPPRVLAPAVARGIVSASPSKHPAPPPDAGAGRRSVATGPRYAR